MDHIPLSKSLEQMVASGNTQGQLTINELLKRTEGRGLYLMIIILCLPFVTPLPIPGVSSVFGLVIFFLAGRLALGLPPTLPRFIGEKPAPATNDSKVFRGGVRFLRFVEKWVKPRRTNWMSWRLARSFNALVIAFMALLLALPLPFPFTNTLPCYAMVFLAASMMEEDGVLIWIAYATAAGSVIYFGFLATAIIAFMAKYFEGLMRFLHLA